MQRITTLKFRMFANSFWSSGGATLVAAVVGLGAISARAGQPAESGKYEDDSPSKTDAGWTITIRPLESENTAAVTGAAPGPASQATAETPVSAAPGALTPRMTYAQALAQIPFSRAEYEANPSYRHDAAMELMFGALRPTTVVKQNIPYFSRYPDFFRNRFQVFPYPQSQNQGLNMYYLWSTNAVTY